MLNIKNIVSAAIIAVFLYGCESTHDDKHYYLSDICKTGLRKGDTLIYRSNTGKIAKYTVHDVANGNIWVSMSGKDGIDNPPFAYYGSQIVYIDTINNNETERNYHYSENFSVPAVGEVQVYYNPKFISIGVKAECRSGGIKCNWYDKARGSSVYEPSYTILSRQFSDVVGRDTDSSLFHSQGKYVKTFYCNIRQGLLGFKYSDEEIYELIN